MRLNSRKSSSIRKEQWLKKWEDFIERNPDFSFKNDPTIAGYISKIRAGVNRPEMTEAFWEAVENKKVSKDLLRKLGLLK